MAYCGYNKKTKRCKKNISEKSELCILGTKRYCKKKNKTYKKRNYRSKIMPLKLLNSHWLNNSQGKGNQIYSILNEKLLSYNKIRKHLKKSLNRVLYVGMGNDILTPLLAFNPKEIISVDAIDPAYINAPFTLSMKKKEDLCKNIAAIRMNHIGVILSNLGGICINMYKETLKKRGKIFKKQHPLLPKNKTSNCLVEKYIIEFSFPRFDKNNRRENKRLISYIHPDYKDWLPPEAINGIDAYIPIGAPSFLDREIHAKKVEMALIKGVSSQKYLLIPSYNFYITKIIKFLSKKNIQSIEKNIQIYPVNNIEFINHMAYAYDSFQAIDLPGLLHSLNKTNNEVDLYQWHSV